MTVVASKWALKKNHFYETEPWCVDTLLRFFPVAAEDRVWEPAAGGHKIVHALHANGIPNVYTSDITDEYGIEHDEILDFLTKPDDYNPYNANVIITNPPYGQGNKLAVAFVRKALRTKGVEKCAMLLTSKFDFGSTRTDLFRDNPDFFGKLNLIDRISWAGNGKTGTDDNCWLLWDKTNADNHHPLLFYGGKNR